MNGGKGELPNCWAVCKLPEVVYFQEGPGLRKYQYREAGVPFLNIRTLVNERVDKSLCKFLDKSEVEKKYQHFLLDPGDLVCSTSGTLGKIATIREEDLPLLLNTSVVRFRSLNERVILQRFVRLYLKSDLFLRQAFAASTGSAQINVGPSHLKSFDLNLPPLAEQKRIVDKLEAVLGRVDACRARLDRVPALLKRFRQSVLAAATSGKLTEDWRDANECGEDAASLLQRMAIERRAVHAKKGNNRKFREAEPVASEELPEIPTTWRWTNFDHCSSEISVGHVGPMKDRYVDNGVAFLRCQNVRPLRFNPHGLVCIPTGFHKELSKSELYGGEILVVRSGANTGDCCVFPCGLGKANCSDLVITRPLSGLSSEYGAIYVNSPTGQSLLDQKQAGVAQPHFNIGAMRVKAFPLAPFAEQQEIVRRVESLFAFADRIEARLTTAQKTVERLTPATLAKAFRGELVPQDPNDEPAFTLLESLRTTPTVNYKKKRKPMGQKR